MAKDYTPDDGKTRCPWHGGRQLDIDYHDTEWGVPVYDSRALFGKLVLDGFQAGVSWWLILQKRENFLRAFDNFEPEVMAAYSDAKIHDLLQDKGIIRNKAKVNAARTNAQAYLELEAKEGSFSDYLWGYVEGAPIVNQWKELGQVPAKTPLSEQMSKELKKRGFKFVGPTIVYAFMQAVGMVNDHLVDCFRWEEVQQYYR